MNLLRSIDEHKYKNIGILEDKIMNRIEILEKINHILKDVFDDDSLVVTESTELSDIEGWDSIAQITIIATIEKEFNVRFRLEDILETKSINKLIDFIEKELK